MHGNRKMQAARELDARLRDLATRARQAEAELAYALLDMREKGLYRLLGFSRLGDYAEARLDMPAGKARELAELARRLGSLPAVERAFRQGELSWTKARQVARVATAENEASWIDRAKAMTSRELEAEVARAKGDTPTVRLVLTLTEEEAANLEDAIGHLREEMGESVGAGAAIAMLVRRATAPPVDRPGYQVVIHECSTCERASRDVAAGTIPVAAETLAEAKEDAEVLDLRAGDTGRRSTEIPPSVRRAVIARDHGRCVICGARRWLHIHHLVPRSAGGASHDPSALCLLCSVCHKGLTHGRFVRLVGRGGALEVELRDGTRRPADGRRRPVPLGGGDGLGEAPARPRPIPAFLRAHLRATLEEVGDASLLDALAERPALAG